MGVLDMLSNSAGGDAIKQIGGQLGIDDSKLTAVLAQLVPALTGGIAKNLVQGKGLEPLRNALAAGTHARYLDNGAALQEPSAVLDGNKILGHLLGGKNASHEVAGRAAAATGVGVGVIEKLLPIVAAATMGALSKHTSAGATLAAPGAGGGMDVLSGLLNGGGGANPLGKLLSLGKKFL